VVFTIESLDSILFSETEQTTREETVLYPKKALIVAASLLLFWGAGKAWAGRGDLFPGDSDFQKVRTRVAELQEDISTINLLNGLNLSQDQMKQILQLAQEARQVRERATINSPSLMDALRQAETSYATLKEEIQKGAPARGQIPTQAAQINHHLKELQDQSNRQMSTEFNSLEGKLRGVLTPEQLKVVEDFSPCLIPPVDLRSPVRAGQAASNHGTVNLLRRLRAIPEDKWQARRRMIAQKIVNNINENHYRMTEAEKTAEEAHLLAVLDKARQMSDMDFELAKEKLAEQIAPQDKIKNLRAEIEARSPHVRKPQMSRLGRSLLSDNIIPILEQRLANTNLAGVR
jgi:hypothetical protein